eukprot:TRINITY_DN33978_c0_g1_i1.p1 TRINITY_DN33978_c0_g1~~TRINITY_DN33978_c0_g1_i1.p1  ORF type:complete len:313 (-),score=66.09 TRINITY_DN33978_c0_g1_i1:188-1126(-)
MDYIRGVRHAVGDTIRGTVGAMMPESTTSEFTTKGTLTRQEFIAAGDQLTFKFPTWKWMPSESDKQYLITKDVPCKQRVRALDYVLQHNTTYEDDWALPETGHGGSSAAGAEIRDIDDLQADLDRPAADNATSSAAAAPLIVADDDFLSSDKAGLPDLDDLNAALEEEDPSAQAPVIGGGDRVLVADAPDAHLEQSRTYDLTITYDTYYLVPRLWLFGYDEAHRPLEGTLVYEDILSEYIKKTVTLDPHPYTKVPTVSIHPCKHAQVMLKVVKDWMEQGIDPRPDLALFVFLKFISGVVPTINYDFTMDIEF